MFVAILWVLPFLGQSSDSLSKADLTRLKDATVYIRTTQKSGSGFVIRQNDDAALILTNRHVITADTPEQVKVQIEGGNTPGRRSGTRPSTGMRPSTIRPPTMRPPTSRLSPSRPPGFPPRPGEPRITVRFVPARSENLPKATVFFNAGTKRETKVEGRVVYADPDVDLALIRVTGIKSNPTPVPFSKVDEVSELQAVFALGFPLGEGLSTDGRLPTMTITRGEVTSFRENESGQQEYVQIAGDVSPGSSGGPLVDAKGKLVGVVARKFKDTRFVLAIALPQIEEFLKPRVLSLEARSKDSAGGGKDGSTATIRVDLLSNGEGWKSVKFVYRPSAKEAGDSDHDDSNAKEQTVALKIDGDTATGTVKLPPMTRAELSCHVVAQLAGGESHDSPQQTIRVLGFKTDSARAQREEKKRNDEGKRRAAEDETPEPPKPSPRPSMKRGRDARRVEAGPNSVLSTVGEPQKNADDDLLDTPDSGRNSMSPGRSGGRSRRQNDSFRDVGPEGSRLVGMRVSQGDAFGGCVAAVQPIYAKGDETTLGEVYGSEAGEWKEVRAKPGYAVGAFDCRTGLKMDKLVVVFMKEKGAGGLDTSDHYRSDIFGNDRGGNPQIVSGDGKVVRGLWGRSPTDIKALGLVIEP